jgi:hypothetical protein
MPAFRRTHSQVRLHDASEGRLVKRFTIVGHAQAAASAPVIALRVGLESNNRRRDRSRDPPPGRPDRQRHHARHRAPHTSRTSNRGPSRRVGREPPWPCANPRRQGPLSSHDILCMVGLQVSAHSRARGSARRAEGANRVRIQGKALSGSPPMPGRSRGASIETTKGG